MPIFCGFTWYLWVLLGDFTLMYAFQAELTQDLGLTEDVAADGIESFVEDQYQPNNINLLVGSNSQFLYDFDYAHLRRKGCMTEYQKQQREIREQSYIRKPISIQE